MVPMEASWMCCGNWVRRCADLKEVGTTQPWSRCPGPCKSWPCHICSLHCPLGVPSSHEGDGDSYLVKSHSLGGSFHARRAQKMSCWGIMCRNTRSLWADLWHFPQMSPGTEMTKEASLTLELAHTHFLVIDSHISYSVSFTKEAKRERLQTVFPKRGLLSTLSPDKGFMVRQVWEMLLCNPFSQEHVTDSWHAVQGSSVLTISLKYIWSGNIPLTNSNS